jgi:NitT/TauT family transport system permease protein
MTLAFRRLRRAWPAPLSLVVLLAAWEIAARQGALDPLMAPPPSEVLEQLWLGFRGGLYVSHLVVTLLEALCGFLLAVGGGVALGALIGSNVIIERTVNPFLVAFQSMPKIALAPLVIVWFGYGMGSKIVLAAVIAVFPVLVGTITGLRQAEQGRLDVLRSLGASGWQQFRMVRFPGALPHIFAGVNVAAVFVLLGTIVGEFVGAQAGLGTLILSANQNLETAQVFSILAVLAALGLSLHALVDVARRRLLFWAESERLPI